MKQIGAAIPLEDVAETDGQPDAAGFSAGDGLDEEDILTLDLADLVHDGNGEIVLFNDSHLPALAVRSPSLPIESGEVEHHVTAAGEDVSGYRFVAFDNGTKLYYEESLDLLVVHGDSA